MKCDEVIRLMDGYLDGELDAVTNQEIELHFRECNTCQQAYETQRTLVHAIGSSAPYYRAPVELRERIKSSLRQEISTSRSQVANGATRRVREANEPRPRADIFGSQWNWLALAALVLVAAIIGLNLIPGHRAGSDQFLATQLIASHVRSLMASHLTDVTSTDQHTVKPWLDAKLDFAPTVVDLSNEGFPLIGGRLDYLDNRPVAALVYQRRKHFINLFIWPVESGTASGATKNISRQGYQLLHWADSDFNYWAVSDVSENDLEAFKGSFAKQVPRH